MRHVFPGFVLNKRDGALMKHVLICGVNWLGDSIMTMPALQAFRLANPNTQITLLVRNPLADLWRMHDSVNGIITYDKGLAATFSLTEKLRAGDFAAAYILPNSFRSALIPFLGGIRERIGFSGQQRRWLLTRVVKLDSETRNKHQAYEYIAMLAPDKILSAPLSPKLNVPEEVVLASCHDLLKKSGPLIALLPGAARGESKRWPKEYFIELGNVLASKLGARILVLGSKVEIELCSSVASLIGHGAVNLAGKTSISQLAALLKSCDVVVCNDSGGMHLAAAVGSRSVVAIFGVTDPLKTGPIGENTFVLQASPSGNRDVRRSSLEAVKNLRLITPSMVFSEIEKVLECS